MTIDPKETVAGCRLLQIRDFARRYFLYRFDLPALGKALRVNASTALEIIRWLEAKRYIRPDDDAESTCWTGTAEGQRLANASAKQIKRATADRLLRELVERAAQVNRRGVYAYCVKRLTVFGSYLGAAPNLGDLDIGVELQRAEEDVDAQSILEQRRRTLAYSTGRRMDNLVQDVFWPQEEVLRFLKARSPSYHFVQSGEVVGLNVPKKVIFEATARRGKTGSRRK